MPQRQMDKVESKYDLLQWMKVTIAIGRLIKEIADKAGDLRALEEQQKVIDEELDNSLPYALSSVGDIRAKKAQPEQDLL